MVATSTTSQRCSNPRSSHRGPDRGPDEAVGPVAAQDVLGEYRARLAGAPVGEVDPDPAGRSSWVSAVTSMLPRRVTVSVPVQVGGEDLLQLGLVEHVRLGVAVPAGRWSALELG